MRELRFEDVTVRFGTGRRGLTAVDGVSLTVAAVHDDGGSIAVIPHTRDATTLGSVRVGDPVNVETDLLARYVERLMERAG